MPGLTCTTVREALDTFLLHVGELGDTNARQIALDCLNLAYQDISLAFPFEDQHRPQAHVLKVVPGQNAYALPAQVGRIYGTVQNLSNSSVVYPIDERSASELLYPRSETTTPELGAPRHYRLAGITGVRAQPFLPGEALEVLSDSVSEIQTYVHVSGDDGNGEAREVQLLLAATAPIAAGTFAWVDTFAKAFHDDIVAVTPGTSSLGTVTLRVVSDGRVLQTLQPQEGAREHKVIQFYPVPEAAADIAIPYLTRSRVLAQGSDPIPGDWWPALFEGMTLHFRRNTGEIKLTEQIARPALLALVTHNNIQQARPVTRGFHL